MIYDWDTDRAEVISRLEKPALLKICTKNHDEPELIESWIVHHAAIVGFENLLIADNFSSDIRTINVYEKYSCLVTIFRFAGNFDDVHAHPRFTALFEVIRTSARFYAVFDTDERLVLIEDGCWKAGTDILQRLSFADLKKAIPTIWMINKLNSFNHFTFRTTEGSEDFICNMIWGKPILPGKLVGIQPGIHNIEFRSFPFLASDRLHLFLLHLTQLPDRRLRVNKSKLVNAGVAKPNQSLQEIAALDTSALSNLNALRFIAEIQMMLEFKRTPVELEMGNERLLELVPGGHVRYSSDAARSFMRDFLEDWETIVESTLGSRVLP